MLSNGRSAVELQPNRPSSAFGVFHVMRHINVRYLLTYLLTYGYGYVGRATPRNTAYVLILPGCLFNSSSSFGISGFGRCIRSTECHSSLLHFFLQG